MGEREPGVTVADVMRPEVPSVPPGASVGAVARLMVEHGLPGVPVVDGDELVGIVTEADLIAREADVSIPTVVPFLDAIFVADAGEPFEEDLRRVGAMTAAELMTTPVYNIRATASLSQVATLMIEQRVNPVPVVDEALTLVGLVSRADLVRVIARLETIGEGPVPASGVDGR